MVTKTWTGEKTIHFLFNWCVCKINQRDFCPFSFYCEHISLKGGSNWSVYIRYQNKPHCCNCWRLGPTLSHSKHCFHCLHTRCDWIHFGNVAVQRKWLLRNSRVLWQTAPLKSALKKKKKIKWENGNHGELCQFQPPHWIGWDYHQENYGALIATMQRVKGPSGAPCLQSIHFHHRFRNLPPPGGNGSGPVFARVSKWWNMKMRISFHISAVIQI